MLLLITDTSGKDGFVGLVRTGDSGNSGFVELIEEAVLAGGMFSAQLVPQISELLAKHSLRKSDIAAFIVVSGPGSFTGLRVGLAAVKALAEILQKPIVPVSLLEVLALFSRSVKAAEDAPDDSAFRYAVALDASRGEAFVGEYESSKPNNAPKPLGESLLTLENVAALLESGRAKWISTPDQAIFDALGKRVSASNRLAVRKSLRRPRSEEIATLGVWKLKAGETVLPEHLEANYLRRSDAEMFSKPVSNP